MSIKSLGDIQCGKMGTYLAKKAMWLGCCPPIVADTIDLSNFPNFRAPVTCHQSYEVVWLYEVEIFGVGSSWPLYLDEAVRMLVETGSLIVRARDSMHGTLFELKSMLARNPNLRVDLVTQELLDDGSTVTIIDIKRLNLGEYQNKAWTIGVLSNGKKEDNIRKLINKISQHANNLDIEFVIAGPEFDNDSKDFPLRFISGGHDDALPRISEKKHDIIKCAKNSNIAIFHDRYQICDDFFSGFDKYGYDFDYLSVAQHYESGKYYPSYAGFERRWLRWQVPIYDKTYSSLHDGHYINGGLIVVKRHSAAAVNFNALLLHNEAEDVEIAACFRICGIVPRINSYSHAVVIGIPDSYTASFVEVSGRRTNVPDLENTYNSSRLYKMWSFLPASLKNKLRYGRLYVYAKKNMFHN